MKIKRSYYCIVDKNNKPDYRYLFESLEDAQRKIKQIKNSIKGETIFLENNRRDFFSNKLDKRFIDSTKKISIKKGCWTQLRVKEIKMIETVNPEKLFKHVVKSRDNQLCYTKQKSQETSFHNADVKIPVIPNPFIAFDWEKSFLKTKSFVATFSCLCFITILSVLFIQKNTTEKITAQLLDEQNKTIQKTAQAQTAVLGKKDEKMAEQFDEELDKFVVDALQQFDSVKQEELSGEIKKIVTGSPMEQMIPYISQQDRTVAAFLVGIAKKESNFGRRVPVLDGQDCYNYWGYRGIRDRMGTGGHTCFDSPEDAVNTVAGRLNDLVRADVDTPQEMVIWKCGSSCAGHSQGSVQKWISDVNMYFQELDESREDV